MTRPWSYVVLAYYVVMTSAIYAFDAVGDDPPLVVGAVALGVLLAHPLVGWVLRRWYAFLLPLPLVVFAIPAGYPTSEYEPLPTWVGILIYTPVYAALIGVGALARSLVWRRRAAVRARPS